MINDYVNYLLFLLGPIYDYWSKCEQIYHVVKYIIYRSFSKDHASHVACYAVVFFLQARQARESLGGREESPFL